MEERSYLCIDLKSFYSSVECVERGLDPMTTNLVVADPERSDKTICLAVSPSLKALGVHNRCRVFEIPKNINYIMAPPRMRKYIDYAADIYALYIRYISPADIHVYSVDEAFLDITEYLGLYGLTPRQMALMLMGKILQEVGVRAACGIGSNLYLAKIALDITAKHSPDFVGELSEQSYIDALWDHRPLTDFWRIGRGTARRLARYGIFTMRRIADADEDFLYRQFGKDAELLIDHAYGREPATIADIKAYRPKANCITSGQVLMRDYSFDEGRLILREMTEQICLDVLEKGVVTSSVSFMIGYSKSIGAAPDGGTACLDRPTSSDAVIIPAVLEIYDRAIDRDNTIKHVSVSCNDISAAGEPRQTSIFDQSGDGSDDEHSRCVQQIMLSIKKAHGRNAIFKCMDLDEAATARDRNLQIGGHKSGE